MIPSWINLADHHPKFVNSKHKNFVFAGKGMILQIPLQSSPLDEFIFKYKYMTNKEKLEELKRFLDENNIKYHVVRKEGALRDLFLPEYCISVHISDERDREFFEHNRWYNPIFIRDEESADFIIEKMQCTIVRVLQFRQRNYEAHQDKLERKRKKSFSPQG